MVGHSPRALPEPFTVVRVRDQDVTACGLTYPPLQLMVAYVVLRAMRGPSRQQYKSSLVCPLNQKEECSKLTVVRLHKLHDCRLSTPSVFNKRSSGHREMNPRNNLSAKC